MYRSLKSGDLLLCEKHLGELLIDSESVRRLAETPSARQRIPGSLQSFFPEHELRTLNAGRHCTLIMARILEYGGVRELRWLHRRYSVTALRGFLKNEGARLLSCRTLNLWCRVFVVEPAETSWRQSQDPWLHREAS